MTTKTHDAPPEPQRPVDLDALLRQYCDAAVEAGRIEATDSNTDNGSPADLAWERVADLRTEIGLRIRELEAANARLTADAARYRTLRTIALGDEREPWDRLHLIADSGFTDAHALFDAAIDALATEAPAHA